MKIIINDIRAILIDASTKSESNYIVEGFIVNYEVDIIENKHTVSGWWKWENATLNIPVIIKEISKFYDHGTQKFS